MTATYNTVVLHVPPTPMGLLPETWVVNHRCNACRQWVTTDKLIDHAKGHDHTDAENVPRGSFPTAPATSTMAPDRMEPNTAEEVSRG